MVKALFDSNILIDALNGVELAVTELVSYEDAAISAITWMDVAVKMSAAEMAAFQEFLDIFPIEVLQTNPGICKAAALIRGESLAKAPKIPLPDAIIAATAVTTGRTVVTRNSRDFGTAAVHVPY